MSIYKKLNEARAKFHSSKITKTGINKFAKYTYFQLGDFVVPALKIFDELGLCGIVSYDKDLATLTIHDCDGEQTIVITSPASSANLKGCHEIQNLGAVETYQRRYLWVAALEIVEHDVLEGGDYGSNSAPQKQPAKKPQESKPLELMPDVKFSANIPAYKGLIVSGKYNSETLIKFLNTKAILTEDQIQAINEWKVEDNNGDVPQ